MWIVDERYWLMHSNQTLRTVVGKELANKDKEFEQKRPDFVCGTFEGKLILIELKRPSHALEVEDLNQLERYVMICQDYDPKLKSFEAILVGKKPSRDIERVLGLRGARFKVMTFAQLISDAERRYKEYLQALD